MQEFFSIRIWLLRSRWKVLVGRRRYSCTLEEASSTRGSGRVSILWPGWNWSNLIISLVTSVQYNRRQRTKTTKTKRVKTTESDQPKLQLYKSRKDVATPRGPLQSHYIFFSLSLSLSLSLARSHETTVTSRTTILANRYYCDTYHTHKDTQTGIKERSMTFSRHAKFVQATLQRDRHRCSKANATVCDPVSVCGRFFIFSSIDKANDKKPYDNHLFTMQNDQYFEILKLRI